MGIAERKVFLNISRGLQEGCCAPSHLKFFSQSGDTKNDFVFVSKAFYLGTQIRFSANFLSRRPL